VRPCDTRPTVNFPAMRLMPCGWEGNRRSGWYQIIHLGDRGTWVLTTCPGLYSTAGRPGFECATCWLQVQHPNHLATRPRNQHQSYCLVTSRRLTTMYIFLSHMCERTDRRVVLCKSETPGNQACEPSIESQFRNYDNFLPSQSHDR